MTANQTFTNGADSEPMTFDEINADIDRLANEPTTAKGNDAANNPKDFKSLFVSKPANTWIDDAKARPIPKMLFGEFWHQGELCILFADTGIGKSILSVQIADSLTTDRRIGLFKMNAPQPQKVLYFDFELNDKQFEARYSMPNGEFYAHHYRFNENFYRIEIDVDDNTPVTADFEKYLNLSLEYEIAESKADVVIIDNITYLGTETEKAKFALPLMKFLKSLKNKYQISILALAHTPKRDFSKELTVNDLGGSKMFSNLADSIIAIGKSFKDDNLRYIKQIKPRNSPLVYGKENVCVCQITKAENFLEFDILRFDAEREHLKELSNAERAEAINKVKELSETMSQRAVAEKLGLPLATVHRHLKKTD